MHRLIRKSQKETPRLSIIGAQGHQTRETITTLIVVMVSQVGTMPEPHVACCKCFQITVCKLDLNKAALKNINAEV